MIPSEPDGATADPDPLPELAGKVRALEEAPLEARPEVLEEVHRVLDGEVDRLGDDRR